MLRPVYIWLFRFCARSAKLEPRCSDYSPLGLIKLVNHFWYFLKDIGVPLIHPCHASLTFYSTQATSSCIPWIWLWYLEVVSIFSMCSNWCIFFMALSAVTFLLISLWSQAPLSLLSILAYLCGRHHWGAHTCARRSRASTSQMLLFWIHLTSKFSHLVS